MLPRPDVRISEDGKIIEPHRERQDGGSGAARREFGVHDDNAAAGTKLCQDVIKNRKMVRHRIVRQAEQDAIERHRRLILDGVTLAQTHIGPASSRTQVIRLRQHF